MRNVLAVAALLAVPVLSPAQAMHTGIARLVASVDAPAFAFQASAVTAAAPRVFSGLIAPIRLNALTVNTTNTTLPSTVTVEFMVNKAGVPEDVHVVGTAPQATADQVVAAVQKVRYTPGKLDGQVVAVPVVLHVAVK